MKKYFVSLLVASAFILTTINVVDYLKLSMSETVMLSMFSGMITLEICRQLGEAL